VEPIIPMVAEQRGLLLLFLFQGMKESAQASLDPSHLEAEFLDVTGTQKSESFPPC
jgi:hypothetical protein